MNPQESSLSAATAASLPPACVSIDVEEYYHIEAAYHAIARTDWDRLPSRVEANVDRLLELMDRLHRPATFFILGHVARRTPQVVRRIAAAGHEVASHGFMHDRLHRLDPTTFACDLRDSQHLLQDLAQQPVIGYRAPTFSIVPQTAWAIDVLLDAGFQYDASIFPVRHPWYGVPEAPDQPFMVRGRPQGGTLLELPALTWSALGRKWPVAGGGYFRLLPLTFMRRGLAQAIRQRRPIILYFHPWEFDPDMPRMKLSFTGRLRTYTGLRSAMDKLQSILAQPLAWTTLAQALPQLRATAQAKPVFALHEK